MMPKTLDMEKQSDGSYGLADDGFHIPDMPRKPKVTPQATRTARSPGYGLLKQVLAVPTAFVAAAGVYTGAMYTGANSGSKDHLSFVQAITLPAIQFERLPELPKLTPTSVILPEQAIAPAASPPASRPSTHHRPRHKGG